MAVASRAARLSAVVEPLAGYVYFVPEAAEEYEPLGLDLMSGYVLARAAALGQASPAAVAATFYSFAPSHIERMLRWDAADPGTMLETRLRIVRRAGERLLAQDDGSLPEVSAAVALIRDAVEGCRPEGRALFAAHARLPWPDDPIASLWHGVTLLREYRGDGHIAVLLTHDVDGVEALVLHAAFKRADPAFLHRTRGWTEQDYKEATVRLADRGFVDGEGALTDGGGKFREMIEMQTDHLAAPPIATLGEERTDALIDMLAPLAQRVIGRRGVPRSVRPLTPASVLPEADA